MYSLYYGTYDGSANFNFNNVSLESYADAAQQSRADSDCSSNGFDRARADESRYNRQASRGATCIHW